SRVHFHSGTFETIAEVQFHGAKELLPGESALAHLRLQDATLVLPGDRFIVRQFSPVTTMGGGEILDPLARRPASRDQGRRAFLEIIESRNREQILAAITARSLRGEEFDEIVGRVAWSAATIRETASTLSQAGKTRTLPTEPPILVSTA